MREVTYIVPRTFIQELSVELLPAERVCFATGVELRPDGRTVTAEMVCNWRTRNRINQDWYPAILEASNCAELGLSADDLIALNIRRGVDEDHGAAA